jgi:uncharacterized paraquat-inducible protein A
LRSRRTGIQEGIAMTALSVICPHCAATNELIAYHIQENQQVDCSRCRETIGTWHEVIEMGDLDDAHTLALPDGTRRIKLAG